jgi:tRNA nucleotidyltransferase/poly(A) polymerase
MQAKQFYNICNHIKKLIKGTEYEHHVYAVGGCIRSITLDVDIKDIDLCVDIPNGGILFSEWMKENGHTEGDVVVYPQYGTAMFRLKDFPSEEIEVVQTRKEQYRDKNSRNPETVFGTLEEDCFRRDFCCNSLYMNISDGLIKDITRMGYCDITNKIIRTTNDPYIVFNDDALRIMRACRFQAQLGFKIEERTLKGMKDNVEICTFTEAEIESMTDYLKENRLSKLYTGHCTGLVGFELIKKYMGEKAEYLMTGKTIVI